MEGDELQIKKKQRRLIVCLTGMPGAGKSTVAIVLKEKGFSVIIMGDIVREEAVPTQHGTNRCQSRKLDDKIA